MPFFLDTSALVKLFHAEPGTPEMLAIAQRAANDLWMTDLSRIEFMLNSGRVSGRCFRSHQMVADK